MNDESSIERNKYKILLVEDSVVNSKIFTVNMKKFGVNIVTVDNGLQAVERACAEQFQMIFMDRQMPKMDGIEATKIIIDYYQKNNIRPPAIIGISADFQMDVLQQWKKAGILGFTKKPFDFPKIIALVDKYCNANEITTEK